MQKYSVSQPQIDTLLTWIKEKDIVIPEIQRPFVWDRIKVRDLIDSLYAGYPIGYLITWRNPNIKLKNGAMSEGKKILIDGQQRVTALMAAVLGEYVVDKEYNSVKIKIAFHPVEEKFEVLNPAIENDSIWIHDISKIFDLDTNIFSFVDEYCSRNTEVEKNKIYESINQLGKIVSKQIGLIELDHDLDIETVTEIFIRINSKGSVLSQADFAMSKIAANEKHNGSSLRKCIDYFSHLAVAPEFYSQVKDHDKDFANTEYFKAMEWLKNEKDDIYDPSYTDMLRVAFTFKFNRGRLRDLVSLLSGRNFETRTFEEEIEKNSFDELNKGIFSFMNQTNFQRFVMIIRSAGFVNSSLVRSQNALNAAYILYLKLREQDFPQEKIESYVRRWFVMSILTRRYASSPESMFDFEIKRISNNFVEYMNEIETAELSEAFWESGLVQNLNTSVTSSPFFNLFIATQIKNKDKGFLSRDITINDLVLNRGDVHHIFPKDYLKKNNLPQGKYNQIANYVYMQSEINIKIGNKSPKDYFTVLLNQIKTSESIYGGITTDSELKENLQMNCIPVNIENMDIVNYEKFLDERRKLIALKIKSYYYKL